MDFLDMTVGGNAFVFITLMTLSPGINNILFFLCVLHFGVVQAFTFRLGVWVGLPMLSVITVWLVSPLVQAYPVLTHVLDIFGIGFMMYLGYKVFTNHGNFKDETSPYGFKAGVLLQFVNGKAWSLNILAVSLFVNPAMPISPQATTLGLVFLVANIICTVPYLVIAYYFRDVLRTHIRILNRMFGCVIWGLMLQSYVF